MDLAKFKLTKNDFFFVMRRPAGPDTDLIKRVLKRSCFRIMDSCLQLHCYVNLCVTRSEITIITKKLYYV